MTDHMHAPWDTSLHNQIIDAEGRTVCEVTDYWIGETSDGEGIFDNEATRARAFVLATAPDLLDAAVQAFLVLSAELDYTAADRASTREMLDAAIRKATDR